MKIPEKLKVGGMHYKIIDNYKFKETELMGQAVHSQNEIRLSSKDTYNQEYPQQKKEECFVHEMLHAIDNVYNNSDTEEKVIHRLSQGLYQVLQDNNFLK